MPPERRQPFAALKQPKLTDLRKMTTDRFINGSITVAARFLPPIPEPIVTQTKRFLTEAGIKQREAMNQYQTLLQTQTPAPELFICQICHTPMLTPVMYVFMVADRKAHHW